MRKLEFIFYLILNIWQIYNGWFRSTICVKYETENCGSTYFVSRYESGYLTPWCLDYAPYKDDEGHFVITLIVVEDSNVWYGWHGDALILWYTPKVRRDSAIYCTPHVWRNWFLFCFCYCFRFCFCFWNGSLHILKNFSAQKLNNIIYFQVRRRKLFVLHTTFFKKLTITKKFKITDVVISQNLNWQNILQRLNKVSYLRGIIAINHIRLSSNYLYIYIY